MKRLLVLAVCLLFPMSAHADGHMDVIQLDLDDDCSIEKLVSIVNDFNESWGKANGYNAEVVVPIQSEDLSQVFWVGRTANAAAFGAAWDKWRDGQADGKSVEAKLQKRFDKCSTNVSRTGFDVY